VIPHKPKKTPLAKSRINPPNMVGLLTLFRRTWRDRHSAE